MTRGAIQIVLALAVGGWVTSTLAGDETATPRLGVRNGHALAYDSLHGCVLLFGGADEKTVLGDLWQWDGRTWHLLADGGPPPRTFPALAYDRGRDRLVLYGGNRVLFGDDGEGDTFLQDMWEWYEGSWHRYEGPTPAARAEAVMAYDTLRERLVLFGGYRGAGASRQRFGETWEFDGSSWKQRRPMPAPSARNGAAMAYDARRGRVVLFGGSGGPSAETWEWDGSSWSRISAPTAGRYNSVLAYDARLGQILRFGGWDGESRRGDTWSYDGVRWRELSADGPEPRNHSSMTYDERRGVLVLFGGHDGDLVFGDTWERGVEGWSRITFEKARPRVANAH